MTRAVTDILYRTDGTAWASAPVTFERTAGSFDDGSSWPPDEKQVTTDATGAYSVQLWPDAAGSIRSRYHVTYPNGDVFYVSIPDGSTPISMPEIRVAAVAPPVPPSALDAHVAAPDPHAGYLLPAEGDLRYAALVHSQAWSTITGTPTTLGGYGITDAFSQAAADLRYAPIVHSQAWSTISGTPTTLLGYGVTDAYTKAQVDTALGGKANAATTLAGYGITDAYTKTAADARYAPIAHNQAWSTITGTPTTAGGYGIADVYTQTQSNANLALKANLAGGNALTGAQVVTSDAIGTKPLIVKGFLGQTANLQEWQDSTGALKAHVTPTGAAAFRGTLTTTAGLFVPWISGDTNVTAKFGSGSAGNNQTAVSATSDTGSAVSAQTNAGTAIVGVSLAGGTTLDVVTIDSGTSNVFRTAYFGHRTSGTPAANFGVALVLRSHASTNADRELASIAGSWTDPADATRTAALGFSTVNSGTSAERLRITGNGNLGINTPTQFGAGAGVIGLANAATVPSTNPTGGGVLYAEAGSLKWRNTAGTVTVLAP